MGAMSGARDFGLAPVGGGVGVSCDARGAYVGTVPLLKRQRDANGQEGWAPRPAAELNEALSAHYGLPVDLSTKASGLNDVAGALNRGDIFRAQVGTLQLKLPNPPAPAGASSGYAARLANLLHGNGMGDWNSPTRQPANDAAPPGRGYAQTGAAIENVGTSRSGLRPGVIPAQEVIPFGLPWEFLFRPSIPTIPTIPRGTTLPPPWLPKNRDKPGPRPSEEECEKQRREAKKICREYAADIMEGKEVPPRVWGGSFDNCWRGQVSEDCGGNPILHWRLEA
jgi:hypothetical protein